MSVTGDQVVILGGGIHGVSTAYYLSTQFNLPCVIVEQTSIACAASGKAGGFLAREWGSGPTIPLHKISYDLHKILAAQLGISSYREVTTLNVDAAKQGFNLPSWINRQACSSVMDSGTAQVTPIEYTEKLLEAAVQAGCEIIFDSADGILMEQEAVIGVSLRQRGLISAKKVVICLGPWTGKCNSLIVCHSVSNGPTGVAVEDWFGISIPMDGIKSSSIIFQGIPALISEPYACFCEEDENGCHLELYPRNNGEYFFHL